MTTSFSEVKFSDIVEELKPMFEQHYEEIAMYRDKIDLKPDYDKYSTIEDTGSFKAFVIRDDDKIVGYSFYFLSNHIHYSDHVYAVNDIVFVHPDYRGGVLAFDFLAYVEDKLADYGVSVVTMHMKTFAAFENLMKCLEYDKAEFLYSKYIGE